MFKANVGWADRLARLFLGATLVALAATDVVGAWGYVGAIPALSAVVAICPLYTVLGISTRATRDPKAMHQPHEWV